MLNFFRLRPRDNNARETIEAPTTIAYFSKNISEIFESVIDGSSLTKLFIIFKLSSSILPGRPLFPLVGEISPFSLYSFIHRPMVLVPMLNMQQICLCVWPPFNICIYNSIAKIK